MGVSLGQQKEADGNEGLPLVFGRVNSRLSLGG